MTRQRAAILEVIRSDKCHHTADEIFELAKLKLPTLSRATVYNNLHTLEDEQIIRRMDKKSEGLFLPVSFDKKTGELKGNMISLPALGKLAERMDGIIKDMGDSLHEGSVDARPLMGGGHTNTCLYCDYKEAPAMSGRGSRPFQRA